MRVGQLFEKTMYRMAQDQIETQRERERRAFLEKPHKAAPDPFVQVKVREAFWVCGRIAAIDEIVSIPKSDACGLVALERAVFV
jgi:hypothetical protein